MDLNKVIIVGRATVQPQVKKTTSGQSVCSFGIATNRRWNDKQGQQQEEVEFHNVVLWGRTAEVAGQYVGKGAIVLIEGRLRTRSWKDREGKDHKTTEIMGERLQLGPRPQAAAQGKLAPAKKAPRNDEGLPPLSEDAPPIDPDELPF